jgi:WD40 repeat protein/serine/threonine protein kinase
MSDRPDPSPDAPAQARQTGEWLGATVSPDGETSAAPPLAADSVPGYELLGELGRGGMGVVYRARHLGLNRVVALKMILAGPHARAADLNRFRAEAEAVARLQHPNVVQVYDVGEANGLPFLSLELCAGSLADRLDGTPWPPKPAAELVETLARAVQAAHQAGIIHRDLKPANVLLSGVRSQESGVRAQEALTAQAAVGCLLTPDSCLLTPKITDFGLAKRLDGSGGQQTATGAVLGTPSYMAPEQAGRMTGASRASIAGPTVDVYALGAILYELLTGRPPFLAASPLDTLLQVTRDDPVPPARLNPKTPRDLQTICLKCLEKEPGRRYPSAAALADDLHRYLTDEPISARPVSGPEKAWKWAKRRPAVAGLIAVSAVAVVILLGTSWYFTGQLAVERDNAMWAMDNAKLSERAAIYNGKLAGEQRQRAEAEALNARRRNYVLAMGQVQLAWQSAAVGRLKRLLGEQVPKPGEEDLRGFEWYYWNHVTRGAPRIFRADAPNAVEAVVYSPDGTRLAGLTGSGKAYLWDLASGAVQRVITVGKGVIPQWLAFRHDGRRLAVAIGKQVAVFDVATGDSTWRTDSTDWVTGLAYLPGDRLVVRAGGLTHLHDAATGRLVRTFNKPNAAGTGLAVSPDGKRVAVGGFPGRVYDVDTGDPVRDVAAGTAVAFSPDGERLALTADDWDVGAAELRVVEVDSGKVVSRARAHSEPAAAVAYSPDGKWVATAGRDHTARLWEPATGKEVRRFVGGARWNFRVAFSPDGRSLAVATHDGTIEVWPTDLDQEANTTKAHVTLGTRSLALDADSGRVLGAGLFNGLIDDASAHKTVAALAGRSRGAVCGAFSPDGRRVAIGFGDGAVSVWDAAAGRRQVFGGLTHRVVDVAFSDGGRRLAAASRADVDDAGQPGARPVGEVDRVMVWDVETAKLVRELVGADVEQVNSIALTADGRRLVTGSGKLVARLWDVDGGRLVTTLGEISSPVIWGWATVAVSPDGRWAAFAHSAQSVSGSDTAVQLFDLSGRKLGHRLEGHPRTVRRLAFGADSRRLVSAGYDDTVRVWDVVTGQELLSRPAPRGVIDVGMSRDGRRLLAVAPDGTLRVWDGK